MAAHVELRRGVDDLVISTRLHEAPLTSLARMGPNSFDHIRVHARPQSVNACYMSRPSWSLKLGNQEVAAELNWGIRRAACSRLAEPSSKMSQDATGSSSRLRGRPASWRRSPEGGPNPANVAGGDAVVPGPSYR